MTKINLDTHEFGHKITPDHPFVKTVEHAMEYIPMPTPIVGHVMWPEDQEKTNALLADLVEQLRVAESERDMFLSLYREKCSQLWEARMSAWSKFKRWFKLQWNYDIYDEHLKG